MGTADGETGLPRAELGFPGPLRDRLGAAVLAGRKTATAGLLEEHRRHDERLPTVGEPFPPCRRG